MEKYMEFLPITKQEMLERGIAQPDFVYVIGDAYVDHPSFGHAIISRILENHEKEKTVKASVDVFGTPATVAFRYEELKFLSKSEV